VNNLQFSQYKLINSARKSILFSNHFQRLAINFCLQTILPADQNPVDPCVHSLMNIYVRRKTVLKDWDVYTPCSKCSNIRSYFFRIHVILTSDVFSIIKTQYWCPGGVVWWYRLRMRSKGLWDRIQSNCCLKKLIIRFGIQPIL
jgi:hypothetical protein